MKREELRVRTQGRGFTEITGRVNEFVRASGVAQGLCHVFIAHTSASLVLGENADPSVRRDLERFMERLVPDGDPRFEHDTEGPDDMPAHIRSVLTHSFFVLPVVDGRLGVGTWQGLYVWEHRHAAHERRILLTAW